MKEMPSNSTVLLVIFILYICLSVQNLTIITNINRLRPAETTMVEEVTDERS